MVLLDMLVGIAIVSLAVGGGWAFLEVITEEDWYE